MAVSVAVPTPTILTRPVSALTVNTSGLSAENVILPALFDVGFRVKSASPYDLSSTNRSEIFGVALATVTFAAMDPAPKLDVAACEAVIVADPAPMMVTFPSVEPTVTTLSSLD